jgi:DNA-binding response OmpR family regulator
MAIRYERGERAAALAHFSDIQSALDRSGHLAGAIWTRVIVCRLLFLHGRRREALVRAAEVEEMSRRCRTSAYDRVLDAAAAEDPLSPGWLARDLPAPVGKAGDATRERAKVILRRAFGASSLQGGRPAGCPIPATPDYGFDRALVELAHAHVARRRGQRRVEALHLRKAERNAADAGADEDLIPQLYDLLPALPAPPDLGAGSVAPDSCLVIDGLRHELRMSGRRIPLGARPVARQLLYAFAGTPARRLTRSMIARVLWAVDYDPLRHDSTVKSNIRRLRTLLAGLAEVHTEADGGYHLLLPDSAVFIPPAGWTRPGDACPSPSPSIRPDERPTS